MIPDLFVCIAILFAIVTIYSKYTSKTYLMYLTKPLPMLMLSLILFFDENRNVYGNYILLAFIFSLLGDLFLMFPKKLFISGLISFLIAHLFFARAFILGVNGFDFLLLIPIMFYLVGYFLIIKDYLGKMKRPVLLYLTVISLMLWLGISRWFFHNDESSLFVMIGSILFVISDSVLGYNKFKFKFMFAEVIILTTYFSAQILFFYSVN